MGQADNQEITAFCIGSLGKIRTLTPEEEKELAYDIQAWLSLTDLTPPETAPPYLQEIIRQGQHAKNKLVHHNLRFAIHIAKRFQNKGRDLIDLINDGVIGLEKAAKKFDPTRGYRFTTCAYWWVRQAIIRELHKHGRTIRLPDHIAELENRIDRERRKFWANKGRNPTNEEIAHIVQKPVSYIDFIDESTQKIESLDTQVYEDGDSTSDRGSLIAADTTDALELIDLRDQVAACKQLLSEREWMAISLFYGVDGHPPHTLNQIRQKLKVSTNRVKQLQYQAIRKCRNAQKSD